MSTTTMNDMPQSATAAVAEATGSRRKPRTNTENAKASIEAARSYFDEANGLGRDLLSTWSTRARRSSRRRSAPRTPRSMRA